MKINILCPLHIKRLAAFIAAAGILFAVGCALPAKVETQTLKPTIKAAPTPKPEGLRSVFGKGSITVAVVSNSDTEGSKLFFEGAQAEADVMGAALETKAAGSDYISAVAEAADSADAVIACLFNGNSDSDILSVPDMGVPVCVFGKGEGSVPEDVSHIYYSPGNEESMAFDAALSFPPHDTPVRLILMLKSKETEGYKLYKKLYDEGKLFPKEVYIASEQDGEAVEWLTGTLGGYVEGMIDGVYAENAELAVEALGTLEALGRSDMEVFCPGVTAETVERMMKNPNVFAQSAGANTYLAGALCVRAALKMIRGGEAVTLELQPVMINASGLKDGIAGLLNMGGQGETFNEDWMDALRAYYGPMKQ